MAGFSKRPHRRSAPESKLAAYSMPAENEDESPMSYANAGYFDDDDDGSDDEPLAVQPRKAKSRNRVIYDEEDDYKPKKKKESFFVRALHAIFPTKGDGLGESVRKIVFDAAVVAFVITGGTVLYQVIDEARNDKLIDPMIQSWYEDSEDAGSGKDREEQIKSIQGKLNMSDEDIAKIENERPGIQPSFMKLYSENSDVVGFIKLGSDKDPLVNISQPVVKAADNDYYLTHTYLKEEAQRGAIFADYRNVFEPGRLSANTILYGHNMWNGDTMFAKLSRYYEPNAFSDPAEYKSDPLRFYREHPTVTFNTIYNDAEWKVFACVLFNTQEELGEVYPYLNYRDFPNEATFNHFILDIMDRSVLWTDVDITYGDEILTLSTCYYPYTKEAADTRVAVFCRKVREGESSEVDISKAQRNPDPLRFAYEYQVKGGSWGGRKWDSSKLLSYNGTNG
ncbi:MAG: class B sortase [Ruminiclostridium sp.]|nr:class B sortase [Ruminiclostridium sp.]